MRCHPYNHLYNSCSKCLITKICSRVCLRVLLSCSFDLGRGEQVPSVTRAPVERRIVSGGQIPVTFKLWRCFQVTMGSNNIANILQRHYSAFSILSHSCNENFLLYFYMLISVRRPLGVWDKVWRTQTQFTLFLFIRLLFFPAQRYSCWIFLFFYWFEAENILVLFLNLLNVVSILAYIGSPFIELLLALAFDILFTNYPNWNTVYAN